LIFWEKIIQCNIAITMSKFSKFFTFSLTLTISFVIIFMYLFIWQYWGLNSEHQCDEQQNTTWCVSNPLSFSYFSDKVLCFCLGPDSAHDSLTYASQIISGLTGMFHHTQLVCWDVVSLTFCTGWSWLLFPHLHHCSNWD
jgi:hypothetical protein